MKIGILQTGIAPDELIEGQGDYPDMFERFLAGRGFDFQNYSVLNNEFPNSVDDADGWLITGSKFGAYEDHEWIPPLEDFIRRIRRADIPLVGVCFGHQIIAQALGGKVVKFDGGWSVGRAEYQMEGIKEPVPLNAWHQDQVVELPKDARVIGHSDFCKYAMLSYGEKVITVQAHPEFKDTFVDGLIKYRAPGVVPNDLLSQAKSEFGKPIQAEIIANMFEKALKTPTHKGIS